MSWKKVLYLVIVIILSVGLIAWTALFFIGFGGLSFLPSETFGSLPEIQRAEFPFKLEYKINEDLFVVEDVLIGEFVRNTYHMGLGKVVRVWRARFESGKEYISLCLDNEKEIFYQPTEDPTIIGTFMGEDTVLSVERLIRYPINLYVREGEKERFTSIEELNNTYNIQIINWEIAPPIENKFN